jgi:predicted DNA-binding transcriptional regulator YafY
MTDFDIRDMLNRQWLERAMRAWDKDGEGASIRISAAAAERLRRDWFYRHASYAEDGDGRFVMTIPDSDPGTILPLVRWLGPDAELLAPVALRDRLKQEIDAIRATYG